jgi:hypothetical protein
VLAFLRDPMTPPWSAPAAGTTRSRPQEHPQDRGGSGMLVR